MTEDEEREKEENFTALKKFKKPKATESAQPYPDGLEMSESGEKDLINHQFSDLNIEPVNESYPKKVA